MTTKHIPYGKDFELVIPCEPDVPGHLTLSIDQDGTSMTVLADDCQGNHAMVFISTEAQALMVMAAMNVMIAKLKNVANEELPTSGKSNSQPASDGL